jgi:hypothetical protein
MTFVVQIPRYPHPFNRFGFDVHDNFGWDIVILKFNVSNRCEFFYLMFLLLLFIYIVINDFNKIYNKKELTFVFDSQLTD